MTYTTIEDPIAGSIKYKKIGDLTADELTGAVVEDRIVTNQVDPTTNELIKISHYDLFDEGTNTAAPLSESKRAANGIDLYKVKYVIKNKGEADVVTGLLAVPVGIDAKNLPMLSWQHGTTFPANESPTGIMKNDQLQVRPPGSVLEGQIRSAETLFNLARFAGNGYAVAAADCNGLGDSKTLQYYAIDKPTTKATAGMIAASNVILGKLGLETTELFLNGWSQGAVNTLFLERSLQNEGISIAKTAHASTFSSLVASVQYWVNDFEGQPYWLTTCIPMVLGSYQEYYNIEGLMASAVKQKYLRTAERIYEEKVDWDQVPGPEHAGQGLLGLPLTGKKMLKKEFRNDIREGRGEFFRRVVQNDPLTEVFTHPSRFFGGGQDTAIPPDYSVEKPVEFLGPLASGVSVGDQATHRSTFLGSLYGSAGNPQEDIFTWFADL